MGYNTEFKGVLLFTNELSILELNHVEQFLGEHTHDHLDWGSENSFYIDLEFSDGYSGLQWNGAEKTRNLVEGINIIIKNMHKNGYVDFGLTGVLKAYGERRDDIWEIHIVDGYAKAIEN